MKKRQPQPYAPRAPELTEEDRALFAAAMSGVQRLSGPARVPLSAKPSRAAKVALPVPSSARHSDLLLSGALQDVVVERLGELVTGRAQDVNLKLVKQLKQGEPGPQATLDLHGRSAAVAKDMLARFVASSLAAGRSCVLVVHGRGHHSAGDGPIIKNVVVEALAAQPLCAHILAFASAPRSLGGEGALMVRLRRSR